MDPILLSVPFLSSMVTNIVLRRLRVRVVAIRGHLHHAHVFVCPLLLTRSDRWIRILHLHACSEGAERLPACHHNQVANTRRASEYKF
jgi:hypothetical protein